MSDVERRAAAIRAFLRTWTGDPAGTFPHPDDEGYEHAVNCAGYAEAQGCCLDASHARFDKLVDGLAAATAARPSRARNLTGALIGKLSRECERQGIALDTYDPDYIVGVIMDWLAANDAALTAKGVRRYRR